MISALILGVIVIIVVSFKFIKDLDYIDKYWINEAEEVKIKNSQEYKSLCRIDRYNDVSVPQVKINKIFIRRLVLLIIIVLIICILYSSLIIYTECMSYYSFIEQFKAWGATVEEYKFSSDLISINLVDEVAETNQKLARYQFRASQWYGFYIPKEIMDLERILINF